MEKYDFKTWLFAAKVEEKIHKRVHSSCITFSTEI